MKTTNDNQTYFKNKKISTINRRQFFSNIFKGLAMYFGFNLIDSTGFFFGRKGNLYGQTLASGICSASSDCGGGGGSGECSASSNCGGWGGSGECSASSNCSGG